MLYVLKRVSNFSLFANKKSKYGLDHLAALFHKHYRNAKTNFTFILASNVYYKYLLRLARETFIVC